MRNYILNIVMLILPSLGFAQSVMGIDFGSSYDVTKKLLEKRFGENNVHKKNGSLVITDFKMGNIQFHIGEFFFQYSNNNSYFNQASFQYFADGNQTESMKMLRDHLYSIIKEKYKDEYIEEYINKYGFKGYKFGLNPKDKSTVLGLIMLLKNKDKNGKENLCLALSYLPINFIDPSSDF